MAIEVFPTANDIGGSGTGRTATEENMAQAMDRVSSRSSVLSGMTPADGGGLSLTVAAGRCQVDGYLVRLPDFESVTVTDDATKYIWLQLTGAGSNAVTATTWVETDDLDSPPANAVLVTRITTLSGAITEVEDEERREGMGHITGTYTGDDTTGTQAIDLGLTPALVQARNTLGNSLFNWANSNIFPGNRALETTPINISALLNTSGDDDIEWLSDESLGGLTIIKDGFSAEGLLNRASTDFMYIAWF